MPAALRPARMTGCLAAVCFLAALARGEMAIEPYRSNYIVHSHSRSDRARDEVRFQFSIAARLVEPLGLHLGYTQRSYWLFYDRSHEFRQHVYNPDLFVRLPGVGFAKKTIAGAQIGWEHESNGLGFEKKKTWDRAYGEVRAEIGPRVRIDARLWYAAIVGDKTRGVVSHTWPGGRVGATVRARFTLRDGLALETEAMPARYATAVLAYRVESLAGEVLGIESRGWSDAQLCVLWWEGYGDGLAAPAVRARTVGAGLRLFGN